MNNKIVLLGVALVVATFQVLPAGATTFDLQININNSGFNTSQQAIVAEAAAKAEALWESVITGYAPGINNPTMTINLQQGSAFADASVTSADFQGGFAFPTVGRVRINAAIVTLFSAWDGSGPTNVDPNHIGKNYIDDILAHEIGHALGIGTYWTSNGVYSGGSFQYTGQHGLAAYRREFDPNATFVPVENAGSSGTMNTHWDQIMRSSTQEGVPSDPWNQDPRTGITDQHGRDMAFELLTGALDPDYGEPFLSLTTIYSLRDLGYTTVPEPTTLCLTVVGLLGMVRRIR